MLYNFLATLLPLDDEFVVRQATQAAISSSLLVVSSKFEAGVHGQQKEGYVCEHGEDALELVLREHILRELIVLS